MSLRNALFSSIVVAATAAPAALCAGPAAVAKVEVHGTGPVQMVLIPGLMCDGSVWQEFMSRNGDRYTMHAVTLAGFGGTDPLASPQSGENTLWLDQAVAGVAEYMKEKDLKSPVVVGHSLGGLVALRVGQENPAAAAKVVTVDGFPAMPLQGDMTPEQRVQLINGQVMPQYKTATDEDWANFRTAMMSSMVTDQGRVAALTEMASKTPRETGLEYLLELLRSDTRADMSKMTMPVLAIAAIGDSNPRVSNDEIRAEWGRQMAGAEKGQVVFFEDTRHFIMEDRPMEFDRSIAEFVTGKPVEGYAAPKAPDPAKTAPQTEKPAEGGAPHQE